MIWRAKDNRFLGHFLKNLEKKCREFCRKNRKGILERCRDVSWRIEKELRERCRENPGGIVKVLEDHYEGIRQQKTGPALARPVFIVFLDKPRNLINLVNEDYSLAEV
ncbi:MAG: hypothetical protein K6C10_05760 [Prevotella sp.]|nr:hypothetical protein [Prevotella sp.]